MLGLGKFATAFVFHIYAGTGARAPLGGDGLDIDVLDGGVPGEGTVLGKGKGSNDEPDWMEPRQCPSYDGDMNAANAANALAEIRGALNGPGFAHVKATGALQEFQNGALMQFPFSKLDVQPLATKIKTFSEPHFNSLFSEIETLVEGIFADRPFRAFAVNFNWRLTQGQRGVYGSPHTNETFDDRQTDKKSQAKPLFMQRYKKKYEREINEPLYNEVVSASSAATQLNFWMEMYSDGDNSGTRNPVLVFLSPDHLKKVGIEQTSEIYGQFVRKLLTQGNKSNEEQAQDIDQVERGRKVLGPHTQTYVTPSSEGRGFFLFHAAGVAHLGAHLTTDPPLPDGRQSVEIRFELVPAELLEAR